MLAAFRRHFSTTDNPATSRGPSPRPEPIPQKLQDKFINGEFLSLNIWLTPPQSGNFQ